MVYEEHIEMKGKSVFLKGFSLNHFWIVALQAFLVLCYEWEREDNKKGLKRRIQCKQQMLPQHNTTQIPFSLNSIYNLQEGESRGWLLLSLTL